MSQKVVEGDLSARVGIRPTGEVGLLCQAIDSMADAVAEREAKLKLATRQQIGQSEKMASIGRLAAGVAHEINNPLTGVLTFAHLLKEEANLDEQGKQDVDLIINETTRAAQIVRGLLDFARERPAVKAPLDINEVIRRTLQLLGNQKAFQQIVIVEDLEDDLPKVNGDENQLQQVLLNLSLNACEAMPDGGTLLVSTVSQNGQVLIKVTDTGCGIKREHMDQIFEPFFSTKPVGKGTGLGLSVTYGIIQQHSGDLDVESQEGKGTTFTIALPCTEDGSAPTESQKVER
jgi:two-component system NtrC family sensor kinase